MKGNYNGYHLAAVLVAGLGVGVGAGVGIGLVLGRVLSSRTVESRVAAKLAAEEAHRQARAETLAGASTPTHRERGMGRDVERAGDSSAEETTASGGGGVRTTTLYDPDPLAASFSAVATRDEGALAPDPDVTGWPPVDRDMTRPYIISVDEFADPGPGDLIYNKISVAWYQGDDVLVDDQENPVRDHHSLVGHIGYRSFGGPSGDEHIVYIRNEDLQTDFEVARRFDSWVNAALNYGRPQLWPQRTWPSRTGR